MFIVTLFSLAVNLDAPIIEKPTIRSEITRGHQSIQPCDKAGTVVLFQMQSYRDCIEGVLIAVARNGSSTSPFRISIRFEAFINMAIAYNALVIDRSATKLQYALTNLQFIQYQDLLKKVGISPEEVCEITHQNCLEIKEVLDSWKDQS